MDSGVGLGPKKKNSHGSLCAGGVNHAKGPCTAGYVCTPSSLYYTGNRKQCSKAACCEVGTVRGKGLARMQWVRRLEMDDCVGLD